MAFKPLSMQRDYTLCSSLDPALDLPEVPVLAADASADDIAARDKIAADRANKLRIARDTGNWAAITKPGHTPTQFQFRQINGDPLTWLQAESERRPFSSEQSFAMAFRLALLRIDNFDGKKLLVEEIDGQRVVSVESLESLYNVGGTAQPMLGRLIIHELGSLVIDRAVNGVRPL